MRNEKKNINKLKSYLKRIYRLSLNRQKQEEIVWSALKKHLDDAELSYGVYEKEKYIETMLPLDVGQAGTFYYLVYDSYFHCRAIILENYPVELTTDLFILSTHFNNLLRNGVVIVNVDSRCILCHRKRDLLIPLLYPGEIHEQIASHLNISKDVYSAFQRLVKEQEAPAIIIADLLKNNENEEENVE